MIDLHVHSTFSDGSFTPPQLIDMACKAELTAIALTDHDTTRGLQSFLEAARGKPIRAIPGVEISADFKNGTMHLLGYFIDPANTTLEDKLKWMREGREARNAEILDKIQKLGFKITWEEVAGYAGEDVVGRPHFAQALVAHGYAANKDEAFDQYLGKGKKAYAERRRLGPEESLKLIHQAGGVSVLGHPFTLNLGAVGMRKVFKALQAYGLGGIEVYYSEHTPTMQNDYIALARDLDLVATGGSDFHGVANPDVKLGVGFGSLRVPDEIVRALEARRPR